MREHIATPFSRENTVIRRRLVVGYFS